MSMTPVSGEEVLRSTAIALKCLMSGGYRCPFGFVPEDAAYIWAEALAGSDPSAIEAAGLEWAQTAKEFPDLAEFKTVVGYIERQRKAEAERAAHPSGVCQLCSGDLWIYPDEADSPIMGPVEVRPCPRCTPNRAKWVSDGHAAVGHDAGSCDHALCKRQQGQRRRGV